MKDEPTDTEAGKVYGTIHYTSLHQKLGDFARHFYKLGKEWKPEGTISVRALMAKNTHAYEKIAKLEEKIADLNHKLNSKMIRIAELERHFELAVKYGDETRKQYLDLERQNASLQKLNDHLAKEVSGLLARLDAMKKRRR